MEIYKSEGIILQALPFQNYDQILSVFTLSEGLIKLFLKGAYSSKKGNGAFTNPLTLAEFIFTKGRSELFLCRDVHPINSFLKLRQDLPSLEAAGDLTQAILSSQLTQKPAPALYTLLQVYLEKMPEAVHPPTLNSSFRLKILRHEGLLHLSSKCSLCEAELVSCAIFEGECYCPTHAPMNALIFNPDEKKLIEQMAFCQYLSQITTLFLPPHLPSKIKHLFQEQI